ncbi:MAG: O-antigen ligase family protein [Candidatus Sericytochromatia bacterium]|nr:O-antigen ligase family protein [Candidatus Sericytochromatia bacterium]
MSTLLAGLALVLMPLAPLLGGLILLLGLIKETFLHPHSSSVRYLQQLSASQKILLGLLLLSSTLTFSCSRYPLHHLAGIISHYLLPLWICYVFIHAVHRGSFQAAYLRQFLLCGLGGLAGVALFNYFGHWHGHLQLWQLPFFDRPYLLDLSLAPATERAGGPALNPNLLGLLMALGWPLALKEATQSRPWQKRLIWVGFCLLLLVATGISFSRSAWLALLAAQLLLLTATPALRSASLVSLASETALLLLPQVQTRIQTLFAAEHSTNELRLQIWQAGFRMLQDFWLTGTGLLQFEQYYPAYQLADRGSAHLHNALLQITVESGLFFTLCLVYVSLRLFLNAGKQPEIQAAWLALGVFACFDFPLADLRVQVSLAILLALQLAGNPPPTGDAKSLRTAEGIC